MCKFMDPSTGISTGIAIDFDFDEFGIACPVLSGLPGNITATLNMVRKPTSLS